MHWGIWIAKCVPTRPLIPVKLQFPLWRKFKHSLLMTQLCQQAPGRGYKYVKSSVSTIKVRCNIKKKARKQSLNMWDIFKFLLSIFDLLVDWFYAIPPQIWGWFKRQVFQNRSNKGQGIPAWVKVLNALILNDSLLFITAFMLLSNNVQKT